MKAFIDIVIQSYAPIIIFFAILGVPALISVIMEKERSQLRVWHFFAAFGLVLFLGFIFFSGIVKVGNPTRLFTLIGFIVIFFAAVIGGDKLNDKIEEIDTSERTKIILKFISTVIILVIMFYTIKYGGMAGVIGSNTEDPY